MEPDGDIESARARFFFLINAPALFNAVVTALELDVFSYLAAHPGADLGRIRDAVGVPGHQLRVLLQAVCAAGLLERDGEGYRNSAVAEEQLLEDGPDSWRPVLVGWRDIYYPAFAQLTPAVKAGKNVALAAYDGDEPTLYARLRHHPEAERVLHAAMGAFTRRVNTGLLDSPVVADVQHLLDVGGGDGTTARALLERHPNLKITVFDLASVTALGQESAVGNGIDFHPGDLFNDEFPDGPDTVLFSHVLEIFAEEQIRELLAKAFAVLPSGGRIIIYGSHVSDDETDGIFSARLSLYLNALATGSGMCYPVRDYVRWLRDVGCIGVDTVGDLPFEHGLVVGRKP